MGWSKHHAVGLIYYAPPLSLRGYTLFATIGGDHASLIDMNGYVCHRWSSEEGISYAQLLLNGNLLFRSSQPTSEESGRGLGGSGAALIELDWDGNKVWEYRDPWLHHDFQRMLNGNTVFLVREPLPVEFAETVQGGQANVDSPEVMLGDKIREVDSQGNTVSEWSLWENLDVSIDKICHLHGRREWTHANSLKLTRTNDFLVSFRTTNTIGIVSRQTGEFTWKWGPGEVFHQHHATQLDNNNILLFDNGCHSTENSERSRVVEINPTTNEITWQYIGSPPMSFYSFHISSAERLPNGNTLICEGAHGRIFEVTPSDDIVWEYINPFFNPDRSGTITNATFRAHRYPYDFTGFVGRNLDPDKYSNLNRLYT